MIVPPISSRKQKQPEEKCHKLPRCLRSPAPAPIGVSFPPGAVDAPSTPPKATLGFVSWTSCPLTVHLPCSLLSLGHQFFPVCWNIRTSKAHDLPSPPTQNSRHSSRHPLAQCREAEGGRGRRQQRMWWGLRQPGQHVQRSCGRKEHAGRRPRWQVHREAGWEVRPGRGQGQALLKVLSFALQALRSC